MAKKRTILACTLIGVLTFTQAMAVNAAEAESLDELLTRVAPDVREHLQSDSIEMRKMPAVTPATIPTSIGQPVTVHGGLSDLSVLLPDAASISHDTIADASVSVFDQGNGALIVPLAKDDGSVQIITVLADRSAPEQFRYTLDLPDTAVLSVDDSGAIHIVNASGEFLGGVAPAWAVDASGAPVPTRYSVDGHTLIQTVEHDPMAHEYPVVADPWLGQDLYYQPWISVVSQGYKVNVVPRAWGQEWAGISTWWAHRDEVVTKLGGDSWRWTEAIQEQFYCHIAGLPASLPTYNMESWRPLVYWETSLVAYRCNPYDGGWS